MQDQIDITGLDKAEVLAALYNGSRPLGLGFLAFTPQDMTTEEARQAMAAYGGNFDYLNGRVLKVNLTRDAFSPWGYDRDNGEGAAARIIRKLRSRVTASA